jgi:hypothetical protein
MRAGAFVEDTASMNNNVLTLLSQAQGGSLASTPLPWFSLRRPRRA